MSAPLDTGPENRQRAVTAAVRTAVTAEASRIAVGTPVSPSNSVTVP